MLSCLAFGGEVIKQLAAPSTPDEVIQAMLQKFDREAFEGSG